MKLTEIRISLCGTPGSRLKAFCSLTFDQTFVVRDIKLIERNDSIFLAMPSRRLTDHCNRCGDKNHLRARYCNNCGARLNENRHAPQNNPTARLKLHADVAHPINAACREMIEREVLRAYHDEVERSKQPGYVAPNLDMEDMEIPFEARSPQVPPAVTPPTIPASQMTQKKPSNCEK
jgi:stage V sporulation protein G